MLQNSSETFRYENEGTPATEGEMHMSRRARIDAVRDGKMSTHEAAAEEAREKARMTLQQTMQLHSRGANRAFHEEDFFDFDKQINDVDKRIQDHDLRVAAYRKIEKEMKARVEERKLAKAERAKEDEQEAVDLDPKSPELLELQQEFDGICDKNVQFIGENQIDGFKKWFEQERMQHPNKKYLREKIKKLTGEIRDSGGLAPRKEEYAKLDRMFARHGMKPTDSQYIKREGLTERIGFRKNAEEMESHVRTIKDSPFYSSEIAEKMMKEMLQANSPREQREMIALAKNVSKKEAQDFVKFNETMSVGGRSIRKMSQASMDHYVRDYQKLPLKERLKWLYQSGEGGTGIDGIVNNEGKLAKELEKMFGKDSKGLNLAVDQFESMDYLQKQKFLKQCQNTIEQSKNAEEVHKKLIVSGVEKKAAEYQTKGYFSEKTAKKYTEFFKNDENFKDPENGKRMDRQFTREEAWDLYKSDTPHDKHMNPAAYKKRYTEFKDQLDTLAQLNPKLEGKDYKDWLERYKKEGWTPREKIAKELNDEIGEQKRRNAILQESEEDKSQTDTAETDEIPAEEKLIMTVSGHISKREYTEARDTLKDYIKALWENDEEPSQLVLLKYQEVLMLEEKFGKQENLEKSLEERLDDRMEAKSNDQTIKKKMEKQHMQRVNIKAEKDNERRFDNIADAETRTERRSIEEADTEEEQKLVEDVYGAIRSEKTEQVLDEDGMAQDERIIQVTGDVFTQTQSDDEINAEYRDTYDMQDQIDHGEGDETVTIVDKNGEVMKAENAEKKADQQEEALAKEMAEQLAKEEKQRQAGQVDKKDDYSKFTDKVALERAKQFVKEETGSDNALEKK